MEKMEIKELFKGCYKNKKVLVTGNTGFKGSWLSVWLIELGAKVYGISNGTPTKPDSLFEDIDLIKRITYIEADIRDGDKMKSTISEIKPDFVFHLAAQPIVIKSYNDPVETMTTNIIGTVNILEALRFLDNNCTAVFITSDKCYDNVEWLWGYRETDSLGGKDPYSASKGAAELMIKSYAFSYFMNPQSCIKVSSVRAGNVIGGGDWAENRIVPDCIRAWLENKPVDIRSPQSTRPWQHVLEPLSGYLLVGQKLFEDNSINGQAFNFGPNSDQNKTVLELIDTLSKYWQDQGTKLYNVIHPPSFHEAGLLKLNCDKALHILNWKPVLNFEETTALTSLWYKFSVNSVTQLYQFTVGQINEYTEIAKHRNLIWCNN
jgi:CDP-glucose 4,6-dehydratase